MRFEHVPTRTRMIRTSANDAPRDAGGPLIAPRHSHRVLPLILSRFASRVARVDGIIDLRGPVEVHGDDAPAFARRASGEVFPSSG